MEKQGYCKGLIHGSRVALYCNRLVCLRIEGPIGGLSVQPHLFIDIRVVAKDFEKVLLRV